MLSTHPLAALLDASQHVLLLMLICMGLAMVLGLMRIINLAHGEFMMLGAYVALYVERMQLPFALAWLTAPVVVALVGGVVEVLIVRRVYDRPLDSLLATWGLAMVLRQSVILIMGPGAQSLANPWPGSVNVGGLPYPVYRLALIGLTVATLTAALVLLYRTRWGLMLRCVMQDRAMAACLGLNTRRWDQWSFACGAGLAGLAGAALAPLSAIDPYLGLTWLVPAFLAVLVGGLDSLIAPLWGAFILGSTESMMSTFFSAIAAELVVFAVAIACLRVRPTGILKRRGVRRA